MPQPVRMTRHGIRDYSPPRRERGYRSHSPRRDREDMNRDRDRMNEHTGYSERSYRRNPNHANNYDQYFQLGLAGNIKPLGLCFICNKDLAWRDPLVFINCVG